MDDLSERVHETDREPAAEIVRNPDVSITDYGAIPDGVTLNTIAIQRAVDACYSQGGGRVVCPPGRFLTGTITLRSNVELFLSAGSVLTGSVNQNDYTDFKADGLHPGLQGEQPRIMALIQAANAKNVAITGPGEINASGPQFYNRESASLWGRFYPVPKVARPFIAIFYRCSDMRLCDTAFVDSPFWTIWLAACNHVTIQGIRVSCDQKMIHSDGIDIDSCCDVTVRDSSFVTGDDCIAVRAQRGFYDSPEVCERVHVSHCSLNSACQGVRIGCPCDGEIRDCTFSHLTIRSSQHGIAMEFPWHYVQAGGVTTADVHDISFSSIQINCEGWPLRVVVEDGIALKRLAGLKFAGFRTRGGRCAINGSRQTAVMDVELSDFHVESQGEGINCQHCHGLRLSEVEISCGAGLS